MIQARVERPSTTGENVLERQSTSSLCLLGSLNDELLLQIAAYLPAKDLLSFQSLNKGLYRLDDGMESLWKKRCRERWEPWPRYRLNDTEQEAETEAQSSSATTTSPPPASWKHCYVATEKEANRTTLRSSDLVNLGWYLSFVLSGVRGEDRSDHMSVRFLPMQGVLSVPGYPPPRYQLISEPPPASSARKIKASLRGDRPFSETQYLQLGTFPPLLITRNKSNAEWLLVSNTVVLVSSLPRK